MYNTEGILRIERSLSFEDCLWAYLECCPELGRYYRHVARFVDYRFIRLMNPAWGSHVTILRREVPLQQEQELWKRNGLVVPFRYKTPLRYTEKHVWLDVECEELLDLRTMVGLPRQPEFALHITVGVMPGVGG